MKHPASTAPVLPVLQVACAPVITSVEDDPLPQVVDVTAEGHVVSPGTRITRVSHETTDDS